MNAKPVEQSLARELSLLDVLDNLLWSRDGSVTLLYRLEGIHHEPGMSEEDFDAAAFSAENALATLPEGTSYQFFVLVDHVRARQGVEAAWPPIAPANGTSELLEELRSARVRELVRIDEGTGQASLITDRRHYLAATFRPHLLRRSRLEEVHAQATSLLGRLVGRGMTARPRYEGAYDQILAEAATFDRRVTVSLLNMGLRFERADTAEISQMLYELLNPTSSRMVGAGAISERSRWGNGLPGTLLEQFPWLKDVSPLSGLLDDDVLVRRDHLRVGDRFVSIVSLKQLPDRTEPGALVGLLRLPRESYRLCYRIDVPRFGVELAELRARATLAAGLQLKDMIVKSDRSDPHASAVERQTSSAMDKVISSTQRILGMSLQVVLSERDPAALNEAVEETLAVMGRFHGLRGYRETYMLREMYLSLLPGAPMLVERRKRTLTPNAVDMLPIFDFRSSPGKVPFLTPSNAVLWYDAFDQGRQSNANILICGASGSGKSVAACTLVSGHEIGAATAGEPPPYVFFLDNGQSYRRYMEARGDGRYVRFSFAEPPGVDIWAWAPEEEPLEEHVSRLELLILDLLKVSAEDEERFERIKAVTERALLDLYRGGHERSFEGLAERLASVEGPGAVEAGLLRDGLYPFTDGKLSRLFVPNPALAMREDIHAICFDFQGLAEHKDLMGIALRLVIYVVRRWSTRVSKKHHRTFLVVDESWAMLDASAGGAGVAATAAPFLAASIRMGRKEGMSVIALSQQLQDFAATAYGAAIVGNSATLLIGHPGSEGVEGLRNHLRLTERQCQQIKGLKKSDRWHEFLLIRGEESTVVRVVLDPLARWVFTTSPRDRDRLASLAERRPELSLMDRIRLLAGEPS